MVRLAEMAAISLGEERLGVLAEMNAFSVEGRYPDQLLPPPELAEAQCYLARAEEVLQWLMQRL